MSPKNDNLFSSSSNSTNNPISPRTNNELKEQSSSSTLSNMSKNSSPNTEITNLDSMDFNFVSPYGMLDEVNKPDGEDPEMIPFETDTGFWEMLDSLGSLQYNNEVEGSQSQSSIIAADNEQGNDNVVDHEPHDSRIWLRYLENELGLEETSDETIDKCTEFLHLNGDDQPGFLEDDGGKIEDINPNVIVWPSPPHNFAF